MRTVTSINALAEISAATPLADYSHAAVRIGALGVVAKSSNGTTPTLDGKWQHSDPRVNAESYVTVGATDNKLKAGATTTFKLGAKFTKTGAASIKSLLLMLNKIGTIAAAQAVTVEVYADSTGPTGSALASTTIDIDSLIGTSYAPVLAEFTTPLDLANGTVYWVVLSASYTASASNCVQWRSNTLASAGNQATFDATTWTLVATQSFEFISQTLTFADITGGAITQVATTASRQETNVYLNDIKKHVRFNPTAIGGTSTPKFYVETYLLAEQIR